MVSLFTRASAPKLKASLSTASTVTTRSEDNSTSTVADGGKIFTRSISSSSNNAAATSSGGGSERYIAEENHLYNDEGDEDAVEAPSLRELNNCLEALAAVFPDVQVEVFREMLTSFDGESRLAIVADMLLKNRVQWVKGRWRTATDKGRLVTAAAAAAVEPDRGTASECDKEKGVALDVPVPRLVPPAESFRSTSYKTAVRTLAMQEFRGLPKSTIEAVLAESNYAYLEARHTLVQLSTKSWRFAISSFLLRRKPVLAAPAIPTGAGLSSATTSEEDAAASAAENHPLVVWRLTNRGSVGPSVRATGSAELDRELFGSLVRPLLSRVRREAEARDRGLAQYLNSEEAAETGQTHECACCFTDGAAFEEFASCSADGHLLCFACVRRLLHEAVFGQGWGATVDAATGTLRCPAAADLGGDACRGRITPDHLRRAVLDMPAGDGGSTAAAAAGGGAGDVLRKLDQRLAEHAMVRAGLPLVRCPFCDYAEVDDIFIGPNAPPLRVRADSVYNLIFMVLCVGTIPFVMPFIVASTLACLLLGTTKFLGSRDRNLLGARHVASEWSLALSRHHRRRRGPRFQCRNVRGGCGRPSCLACHQGWTDVHVCHESSLVSLRTRIEQAMSLAVKRVCPRCATSFVKTAGCNKLTCPVCAYKMCYVCRADIGEDGYRHFCDHFRPEADPSRPCDECDRCNLWESEDTEKTLRKAREEAERAWREEERRGGQLSRDEREFLETGFLRGGGGGGRGGSGGAGSASSRKGAGLATPRSPPPPPPNMPDYGSVWELVKGCRFPTLGEVFDIVIETIFF